MVAWLKTAQDVPWNYRKYKNIQGTSSGSQTNYQMKLTMHWGGGTDGIPTSADIYLNALANQDFSDVRFTSSDGTTLLGYWIDPSTYTYGIKADVWIKVLSTPPNGGFGNIYVYYGNSSQTSASTGRNTFLVFDDFSTGSTEQWTKVDPGAQITIDRTTNHRINYYYNYTDPQGTAYAYLSKTIPSGFEAYFEAAKTNVYSIDSACLPGASDTLADINSATNSVSGRFYYNSPNPQMVQIASKVSGSFYGSTYGNSVNVSTNTPYWMKLSVYNGSGILYVYSNASRTSLVGSTPSPPLTVPNRSLPYAFATSSIPGYRPESGWITNIFFRNYVSPEPLWSDTGMQETYTINLTISSIPSGAEIYLNGGDQFTTTTDFFTLYPGIYDVLLTKAGYQDWWSGYFTIDPNSPDQQAHGYVVTGNLAPALITATDMILDKTSCLASCTVTATITWNNPESTASFEPAIVVDSVRTGSGSTIVMISGQTHTRSFSIPLGVGSHNICPDPN